MEKPSVVENPDGPIYIAVSEYNPIKNEASEEGVPIMVGEERINIGEVMLMRAMQYEQESAMARGITTIDFIINMMNLWFFFQPMFGMLAFVALLGYKGVQTYNKGLVFLYLVYQYLLTIGKGVIIVMAIDNKEDSRAITFISIATVIQMWVTYSIQKFYNKIDV